ncbi:hypothetical protein TNCV_3839781 [Trichonephila clavipes]|nr:hypothetical protein TNCV_3839781 [Trichonephila clavipes]
MPAPTGARFIHGAAITEVDDIQSLPHRWQRLQTEQGTTLWPLGSGSAPASFSSGTPDFLSFGNLGLKRGVTFRRGGPMVVQEALVMNDR